MCSLHERIGRQGSTETGLGDMKRRIVCTNNGLIKVKHNRYDCAYLSMWLHMAVARLAAKLMR